MKIRRMRNNVKLTDVITNADARTYGFGLVLDGSENPSFVFFPPRVITQYEITEEDIGAVMDCVFREDNRAQAKGKKDPVVMAILEEGDPVKPTVVLDEFDEEEGPVRDDVSDLPSFVTRG